MMAAGTTGGCRLKEGRKAKNMARIHTYLSALRMYQWTKNLLVLAPLIFAKQMHLPDQVMRSGIALAAFCLAASATYLFNDLMDIEKDRAHPAKRKRPLPSGALDPATAWAMLLLCLAGAVALAFFLGRPFFGALCFYVGLTTAYSLMLKHMIIIDVLCIALGFVLRAMAGAVALDVAFSNWLVVCTLFLALFLGLCKRRQEILLLEEGAENHRRVLLHYTVPYIDQLILIVSSGALITYTIYTCSPEVVERLGTDKLYMTLPFVVYGLFLYLFLVHHSSGGGDPSAVLMRDRPLGFSVVLWAVACATIMYFWSVPVGVL
jgi:4-hydroxybenzoate polyprenyltransferase